MAPNQYTILPYQSEYQPLFERFNRRWIEEHFQMEPIDEFVLTQPEKAILEQGGAIWMISCNQQIVGTVALKKINSSEYELTKMAVEASHWGRGLGEALCRVAIQHAKAQGAQRITLYSHTSLESAIRLYQKLGFREIPLEQGDYARSNIKMVLYLDAVLIMRATLHHAPEIAAIGRASFGQAFTSLFNRPEDLAQYLEYQYNIKKIKGSLEKPNRIFFLALKDNQAVGFAKIKKQSLNQKISAENQMELQKIYVLPSHHGTGTGQALMNSVLGYVQKFGPCHLWLDVIVQNHKAIQFYEKNGFSVCAPHFFTIGSQMFEYHVMATVIASPVSSIDSNQ